MRQSRTHNHTHTRPPHILRMTDPNILHYGHTILLSIMALHVSCINTGLVVTCSSRMIFITTDNFTDMPFKGFFCLYCSNVCIQVVPKFWLPIGVGFTTYKGPNVWNNHEFSTGRSGYPNSIIDTMEHMIETRFRVVDVGETFHSLV